MPYKDPNNQKYLAWRLEYSRAYREKNRERLRSYQRNYVKAHPESARASGLKWRTKNREKLKEYRRKNRPTIAARSKLWIKSNPSKKKVYRDRWLSKPGVRDRLNGYLRERYWSNLDYRIASSLRKRVRQVLNGNVKSSSTERLLGCSIASFRTYLESKFEEGMSWDNYGDFWEIDHIIPCAIFDLSKEDHQNRCFHFSNQQPLTVTKNRSKCDKLEGNVCSH